MTFCRPPPYVNIKTCIPYCVGSVQADSVVIMVQVPRERILEIGNVLNDGKRPLKERFRALFTLKNIGGLESIDCINQCFGDESALLKHELAYCLGQMQDPKAIPMLVRVLEDVQQEPMVRHEAGNSLFLSLILINE